MNARPLFRLGLLLVAALGLGGCPGQLENAEELSQLPACPGNIDVRELFITKCGSAICHGNTTDDPSGGLDLVSPGVEHRLVSVQSEKCGELLRVDPNNPDNSFLLGKVIEPPAGCGSRMPLVGRLSPAEVACVRAYIHSIADTPVDGGNAEVGP
jgi:hypothetical protein